MRAARRGDRSAFRELYERHAPVVFRVALRMLGHRTDAEDVTQEVFVTLFRRLPSFDFRSAFETWVYRITVNACYDVLRRRQRRAPHRGAYPEAPDDEPAAPDRRPPPLEAALAGDVQRHVAEGLARLHPDLRAALVLKEIEDRSYQDIADVLGCSTGTVASRLARARAQMAAHLQAAGIDATYFH